MGGGVITARFPGAEAAACRSGSLVRLEDETHGIPKETGQAGFSSRQHNNVRLAAHEPEGEGPGR